MRWLPNLLLLILIRKFTSHLGYWKNKHDPARMDRNKRRAACLVLTLLAGWDREDQGCRLERPLGIAYMVQTQWLQGKLCRCVIAELLLSVGKRMLKKEDTDNFALSHTQWQFWPWGSNRIYHSSIFLYYLEHFDPQKILFPSTSYPYFLSRF